MVCILFKVGLFTGPGEMIGNFSLSMIIDEDVERPYISYFFTTHMKHMSSLNNSEDKIPKLDVIKIFLATTLTSIRDLVLQQKWEIVIIDL